MYKPIDSTIRTTVKNTIKLTTTNSFSVKLVNLIAKYDFIMQSYISRQELLTIV